MAIRWGAVVFGALLVACASNDDDAMGTSEGELAQDGAELTAGIERRRLLALGNRSHALQQQGSVHLGNAYWLARFSLAAYRDGDRASEELRAAGVTVRKLQTFASPCTGAAAIYFRTDEYAVLAFRGTEPNELLDLGTDLASVKIPWAGPGLVHMGFAAQLESLWSPDCRGSSAPLYDFVKREQETTAGRTPLYVTGHSLGGALATLFMGRVYASVCQKVMSCTQSPPLRIEAVYTFGSPKVGDDDFAYGLAGQARQRTPFYRFVHKDDLVTVVPRNVVIGETQLVGDFRHVGPKGEGEDAKQVWFDERRLTTSEFVAHVAWSVADHDLERGYIPRLEGHAKRKRELR